MKFSLDPSGKLKYRKDNYEEDFLLDENVLLYGSTMDNESNLHLVYLQKSGVLNYVLFIDGKIHESIIGNFDTRSNTYNQIEVLYINRKLNIFYSYSNIINSNIYTLHHVIINDKSQDKYNIIRFASKKREKSFSVANDTNGIIHLLYNTVSENFSYIYYTYFNPYKGQWLLSPTKLSSSDHISLHPTIFVDSKDNIHSSYWILKDKNYSLKIYRMAQVGREMYKWLPALFPPTLEDNPLTIISEEGDRIIIKTMNSKLISKDLGLNYLSEDSTSYEESSYEKNNHPLGKIDDQADGYKTLLENNTNLLKEEVLEILISKSEMELYFKEFKDLNNENKNILEQVLLNQYEFKHQLHSLMDELTSLNTRLSGLEEAIKNSKSGLKKFFS